MTLSPPDNQAGSDVPREDQQPGAARRPLDSAALLQGDRWVEIRHNGEVYRLQATRQGKLILTK